MAKRKLGQETSKMIFHIDGLECVCGKDITCLDNHICTLPSVNLEVVICVTGTRCEKKTHERWFCDLWDQDSDGYTVCKDCQLKCPVGELPKQCECDLDEKYEMFDGETTMSGCELCRRNDCMVGCAECHKSLSYGDECEYCIYVTMWTRDEVGWMCTDCDENVLFGRQCVNNCIDEDLLALGKRREWDEPTDN